MATAQHSIERFFAPLGITLNPVIILSEVTDLFLDELLLKVGIEKASVELEMSTPVNSGRASGLS